MPRRRSESPETDVRTPHQSSEAPLRVLKLVGEAADEVDRRGRGDEALDRRSGDARVARKRAEGLVARVEQVVDREKSRESLEARLEPGAEHHVVGQRPLGVLLVSA